MLQILSNAAGERGFSYVVATWSCPAKRGTRPHSLGPASMGMTSPTSHQLQKSGPMHLRAGAESYTYLKPVTSNL